MTRRLSPVSATIRPTGAGRILLVATAAAFLFAWGGAGVEFSTAAMLGGALCAVAAVSTWRHASALRIEPPPPVTAFAAERFVLDVPVANLARRAAAFDVLFSPVHPLGGRERIGALLPRLGAGEETRVEVLHPPLPRGLYPQGRLELSSSFPLGLWTCRVAFELPDQVLVLPRLGTLRRFARRSARVRGPVGHGGTGKGDEQEVYGVRDWREGEGLRAVQWKLSARRGRLLVREMRSDPRPPVHVVLATGLESGTRSALRAFEDAVSFAATLVEDQVRSGHAVRLTLHGRSPRTIVCRRGGGAIFPVLRALAQTEPEPYQDAADAAPPARGRPGERTYVVRVGGVAAPRGDATVFDMTDRTSAAVFDRRRRPGSELLLGVRR